MWFREVERLARGLPANTAQSRLRPLSASSSSRGRRGTTDGPRVLSHASLYRETHPSELLVFQGQDTSAFCEQLYFNSRQRMGCGEVALGAPAVERMTDSV